MKKSVLVLNTAASEGGALTILENFAEKVKKFGLDIEWYFILSDNYITETENVHVIVIKDVKKKINRLSFDFYKCAKITKSINPDIIFTMQNITIRGTDTPQILYLHQSLPFQKVKKFSFFNKKERKLAIIQYVLGNIIVNGLDRANTIIVQTEWMKKAVLEKKSKANIKVIPPDLELPTRTNIHTLKTNSFFYPTSDVLYKNIELIEKACQILNFKKKPLRYSVEITIDRNTGISGIEYIDKISKDEVFNKLKEKVLIFPSLIETYGLPLAEARATGTIVLAGDTPFAREILNGYENAFFFNVNDPNELANLMKLCIEEKITLKESTDFKRDESGWEKVIQLIQDTALLAKKLK
ncbi:MAG: glycosyltransferase [Carnobacterium sp.]|uniref:glycosyltransferase n=1 Tax=Carnobacterium sp. TaxID=48221 RepID=UPI003314F4D3